MNGPERSTTIEVMTTTLAVSAIFSASAYQNRSSGEIIASHVIARDSQAREAASRNAAEIERETLGLRISGSRMTTECDYFRLRLTSTGGPLLMV